MNPCPITKKTTQIVSGESLALIAVCSIDMILTIILLATGLAVEANPLMQRCFQISVAVFCVAKMVPLLVLVGLCEWQMRYNPVFVKRALKLGTAAYVGFYTIAVLMVNIS